MERCQCPFSGEDHKAHKCESANRLNKYKREEETLWLCANCALPGDEEVEE